MTESLPGGVRSGTRKVEGWTGATRSVEDEAGDILLLPIDHNPFFLCLVEVGYPFGDEILASTYIYENILDDVSWIIIIIYCYVLVNYSLSSLLLLLL